MCTMPKLWRAFMAGRPLGSTFTPRQPTGAAPNHVRAASGDPLHPALG
ncbi:hypothetical protein [Mycobacterium tuberculosis]